MSTATCTRKREDDTMDDAAQSRLPEAPIDRTVDNPIGVTTTAHQIVEAIMSGLWSALEAGGRGDGQAAGRAPVEHACEQVLGGVVSSLAQLRQWMVLGRPQHCTQRRRAWRLIDRSMERLKILCHAAPGSGLGDAYARLPALTEALRAHQEDMEDIAQDLRNEPALFLYWSRVEPESVTMADAIDRLARQAQTQALASLRRELLPRISETRTTTAMALAKLETYLNTGNPQALARCESLLTQSERALAALSDMAHLLERSPREALHDFQRAHGAAMPLVREALRLRGSPQWHLASAWMAGRAAPCASRLLSGLDDLVRLERTLAAQGTPAGDSPASPWDILLMGGLAAILLSGAVSPDGACLALGREEEPPAIPVPGPIHGGHRAGAPNLQQWLGEATEGMPRGSSQAATPMGPRKHRPAGTAAPDSLEQVSRLIASIEELKATLEAHLSADHPSAPETAGSAAHTTDVVYPTP